MSHKPHTDLEEWIGIAEAAAAAGVSTETIRRWERAGRIPPAMRTLGGQRRYKRADLVRLAPGLHHPPAAYRAPQP